MQKQKIVSSTSQTLLIVCEQIFKIKIWNEVRSSKTSNVEHTTKICSFSFFSCFFRVLPQRTATDLGASLAAVREHLSALRTTTADWFMINKQKSIDFGCGSFCCSQPPWRKQGAIVCGADATSPCFSFIQTVTYFFHQFHLNQNLSHTFFKAWINMRHVAPTGCSNLKRPQNRWWDGFMRPSFPLLHNDQVKKRNKWIKIKRHFITKAPRTGASLTLADTRWPGATAEKLRPAGLTAAIKHTCSYTGWQCVGSCPLLEC